ncbi:hypothetical protein [Myxococcus landrumensis]|uniref:Uncharacterized protein n=1 Tax=Myxococcus landrumensis TaxID=2813577 RepID=A0ABX7N994_9BACT|nr:hypothetical protein [Myxococcus landrumus]QSQ15327.1 hypothetical protein JY572_04375 [Myxococcus landrumus]
MSGKPLLLALTQGEQHESTMAEELLMHAEGGVLIADTAKAQHGFFRV